MIARASLVALLLFTSAAAADTVGHREAEAHYKLGRTQLSAGDIEGAIRELTAALQAEDAPGIYFMRAEAYRAKGAIELALADYERFVKGAPLAKAAPEARAKADAIKAELARQSEAAAKLALLKQQESLIAKVDAMNLELKRQDKAQREGTNPTAVPAPGVTPTSAPSASAAVVIAARPAPSFLSSGEGKAATVLLALGGALIAGSAATGSLALSDDSLPLARLTDGLWIPGAVAVAVGFVLALHNHFHP